jgi:hypothetical protein
MAPAALPRRDGVLLPYLGSPGCMVSDGSAVGIESFPTRLVPNAVYDDNTDVCDL